MIRNLESDKQDIELKLESASIDVSKLEKKLEKNQSQSISITLYQQLQDKYNNLQNKYITMENTAIIN